MVRIAPYNNDQSTSTATTDNTNGFESIDANDSQSIVNFFTKNFGDVVNKMPFLCDDYRENPIGSLVNIKTNPWLLGKILLIGDAAHAVVPFYGQV